MIELYFPAAEGEGDVSDPPVAVIADPEETATMSQIFCGANPFCYSCDEPSDFAAKNINVVDWRSPPRKKPRMGVRVPVYVGAWPSGALQSSSGVAGQDYCRQVWHKWSWLFHLVNALLLPFHYDRLVMAPRIRGIGMMFPVMLVMDLFFSASLLCMNKDIPAL